MAIYGQLNIFWIRIPVISSSRMLKK